jgi:PPOX class probable F420-dependent enzyme
MLYDINTELGARVARRLEEERVIWLTTVRDDGTPQPTPVWFIWDGESFLIYSQPQAFKLRNIARNPRVALNFNSDKHGEDVIVFRGNATIDRSTPPADQVPTYIEKYRSGIQGLGSNPGEFSRDYSVAIRVRPTRLRGF